MRINFMAAVAAVLLVSACGGGQTEATEAEEALNNDLRPAAPAPGGDGNAANAMSGETPGSEGSSTGMMNGAAPVGEAGNSM